MKISVSFFTWILWLVALLNGSIKAMAFLFLLMTLHELAHVLMAAFFHLTTRQITIYPFGLCAQIQNLHTKPCLIQLCVLLAGPIVHMITPLLLLIMMKHHWISPAFYQWCLMMNTQILIFNLLPIFPLDGGRMLLALLFCLVPVKRALQLHYGFSLAFIAGLYFYILPKTWASAIVCFVLLSGSLHRLFSLNQEVHDMKLVRLLEQHKYPIFLHNKNDYYLFRHNVYIGSAGLMDEKEWLWQNLGKNESQEPHFMV